MRCLSSYSGDQKIKIRNLHLVATAALAYILVIGGTVVHAQHNQKVSRIGYLTTNSAAAEKIRVASFVRGLRALGYFEGQNLAIDYRFTDGRFDRLAELVAELVKVNVDVLVVNTTNAAIAAKNATSSIPI